MKWLIRLIMRILYIKRKSIFTPVSYGLLYNWWVGVDARGIAPSGWHMPTETEMDTLDAAVGGITTGGTHLKEANLAYWININNADNSTGFSARGAGSRNDAGLFSELNNYMRYWNSNQLSEASGCQRYLSAAANIGGNSTGISKKNGISVRLIKNDSTNTGSMTDYDGNVYPTVLIGGQVWMATNLIVKNYNNGDPIANVTDATAWAALTTGAWCYYNNDSSYQ